MRFKEPTEESKDTTMCIYPFSEANKYKLDGFWLVGETEDEKKNAIV